MVKLYAALETALAVIQSENDGWNVKLHLLDTQPHCIAVDPAHPQIVYCGTFDRGAWVSNDAGASWRQIEGGIAGQQVTSIAVSILERGAAQNVVYVGSEPSAMFRSEDGGKTWEELVSLKQLPSAPSWSFPPKPYTSHVRWITPDPLVEGRLFAAIEAGALIRSHDGGHTWEDRQPDGPLDTHTLVMHPKAPNHLYSAAGDGFINPGGGFLESPDGGDSWLRPDEGLKHHYLWSVAVDAADPTIQVISAASSPMAAHNPAQAASALYRRAGNGPWQQLSEGLPPERGRQASVLATHAAEPGSFYAASNQGIYRSRDAGLTWEQLPLRWPDGRVPGRIAALAVAME